MTKYCINKIKEIVNIPSHHIIDHAVLMEKELNRICKKVWTYTNKYNDKFVFGKYINPVEKSDSIIVTLGYYEPILHRYIHSK